MSDTTVEQRERPVFAHGPMAVLNLYQHRPCNFSVLNGIFSESLTKTEKRGRDRRGHLRLIR